MYLPSPYNQMKGPFVNISQKVKELLHPGSCLSSTQVSPSHLKDPLVSRNITDCFIYVRIESIWRSFPGLGGAWLFSSSFLFLFCQQSISGISGYILSSSCHTYPVPHFLVHTVL